VSKLTISTSTLEGKVLFKHLCQSLDSDHTLNEHIKSDLTVTYNKSLTNHVPETASYATGVIEVAHLSCHKTQREE